MPVHIALRCDARPETGTGHVVRCLALGDELASRGVHVSLLGEVTGVPWLTDQIERRGLAVVAAPDDPEALATLARDARVDAVVLDGYHLDPGCGRALHAAGITVLSVLDDTFGGGQEADLYLDQNFGATPAPGVDPERQLLGLDYSLFRDEVLRHRPTTPRRAPGATPRVLAVFGGSDPYAAAPVIVPLLLASGRAMHVVAVAARPEIATALEALPTVTGQHVEVVAPTPDLAALAATCDVAVTAAGSSVWEFLCLGLPSMLVCVVDNQSPGYEAVTQRGLAEPFGHLSQLRGDEAMRSAAVAVADRLLSDPERQASLAAAGMSLVDGKGRARVADALEYYRSLRPER
ncbi:PseG/SpsG family protein [Terrabacter sp. 2RAF25]|uniref:PseG/SpsG family protein n=1 Tax=Terrabacter sp. 2RAF25 TaxID=3232998 RepID=UPI003F965079